MAKGFQDIELYSLFLQLNQRYFDNWLPNTLIISRSNRLKRKAGVCYFYRYPNGVIKPLEICLSDVYINTYSEDTASVLLHEMIHMKIGHIKHNWEFVAEMNRLNLLYNLNIKIFGKNLEGGIS